MLVRFWADVIALQPKRVQILAGTNDIAGNTGPTTEQDYENNIMAMVELAQAQHIRVLLASLPPASSFWWTSRPYRPAAAIRRLNAWLRGYASSRGTSNVAQGPGRMTQRKARAGQEGRRSRRRHTAVLYRGRGGKLSRAERPRAVPDRSRWRSR